MENFQCKTCQHQFFVPRYRIIFRDHHSVYIDKRSELIYCPQCRSTQVTNQIQDICLNIGEFTSGNMERRQSILRRRAKRAARRYEEQRHVIEKEFRGHADESFY